MTGSDYAVNEAYASEVLAGGVKEELQNDPDPCINFHR